MKLNLLADVSNFSTGISSADKEAKGLSGKMEKYGKRMAKAFAVAAAAAGAMAIKIGLDSVKAASDLNEEISKTEVIFGDTAEQIKAFAKTADVALGLTQKEALTAASTFATLGKNAGLTGNDLSKFSISSTQLASDLGSFYNTKADEAILAIGSAMRGEAEPIRKYGVLISAASLDQAALNYENRTGTELERDKKNQLTETSKVLARYQAIIDQTKDAQGDFNRTSEGLAAQQKILNAQLENLKTTMGESLLPTMKEVVTQANFVAAAFGGNDPESLSERARELAGTYDGQGGGAYNLGLALINVGNAFSRMFDSMSGPNATEAGTALQNIANAINGVANAFNKLGTAYTKIKPFIDKLPASIIRNKFWDFVFSSADDEVSRAAGGSVMAGQTVRVGEFGPETFVAAGSGSIRPDSGSGSGVTIIMNGVIDGESARRSIERLLQDSARRTGAINLVGATL
jgi:uncharacterized phage infection (PIP) family protein YhgE